MLRLSSTRALVGLLRQALVHVCGRAVARLRRPWLGLMPALRSPVGDQRRRGMMYLCENARLRAHHGLPRVALGAKRAPETSNEHWGWLPGLGLERYEADFRENEIDRAVLSQPTMTI